MLSPAHPGLTWKRVVASQLILLLHQHHCRQVQVAFLIISGLMGNVNIDSVIPYILNMNTAASSEHLDDSDDDIVDHEADDDQD